MAQSFAEVLLELARDDPRICGVSWIIAPAVSLCLLTYRTWELLSTRERVSA